MKNLHRVTATALGALFVLGIAACGGGGYDREELISTFTTDGAFTEEQATCVADSLEASLSTDQLAEMAQKSETDEVTAEETAALETAFTDCLFGDLGDLGDGTTEGEG